MDSFDLGKVTLSIDADGTWRHEGVEITHERTWKLFSRTLDIDEQGRYFLQIKNECAVVEVVDAPFVVATIRVIDEGIRLTLVDGTQEMLDPGTIRISDTNIPYCKVRNGKMEARFSRTAYHQLAELIVEEGDGYFLKIGETRHRLTPAG
jgi:uncharacterized protein